MSVTASSASTSFFDGLNMTTSPVLPISGP
jgi:hypothetical protein